MADANNAWHRLVRAMRPIDPTNMDGPWSLLVNGSVNLAGGGGAGGTSMVDNNPFTPGGTSITPAGGYVGGRTIASGNAGAIALSPSGAVLVHVIAGGAGGGLAQLQVVGSDNSNFANVGWPSGGSPTYNSVPVQVINAAAIGGGGGFASVGVYGSVNVVGSVGATQLGAPWTVTGSVRTTGAGGSMGVTQVGAPWSMVGSVAVTPATDFTVWLANQNAGAGFASVAVYGSPGMPVYNVGSVNVVNPVGIFGSVTGVQTVNLASHVDTANSAVRVNVVAGGAGGGLAQMQVIGTDNSTWLNVGQPSGNTNLFHAVPVWGTVNMVGGGGGFASVAVYGSPGMPVYNVGSVNVVNAVGIFGSVNVTGSINPHGVFAPAGSMNVVGSVGATQLGAPWTVTGSIGVTPLAAFSLGGVPVVDSRGSLVPTQWMINASGAGTFLVASMNANQRLYLYGYKLVADATLAVAFQSPSGTFLEGTQQLLPGAGFAENAPIGTPLLSGAAASGSILINLGANGHVGGIVRGWIGP